MLGPTVYLHVERRLDAHHERVMATTIVEQNDGADDDDALDLGVEREEAVDGVASQFHLNPTRGLTGLALRLHNWANGDWLKKDEETP